MKVNSSCTRVECPKEFSDDLNFCQVCGERLMVADEPEPAFDPYATIVAPKSVLMAEEPAAAAEVAEPEVSVPEALPIAEPDDLLDLPTPDPLKTMFASDAEMKEVLEVAQPNSNAGDEFVSASTEENILESSPQAFDSVPPASFDPPPSPFAEPQVASFEPQPTPAVFDDEPATVLQAAPNPFDMPAPQSAEIAPSYSAPIEPAYGGSFGGVAASEPITPAGQNKTLAIVSLVLGILGVTLCCGTLLPSLIAIIIGFMARGKAANDPANFGGSGMALGGLITGVLGLLLGIAYLVFMFVLGGLQMVNQSGF